MRDVQYSLAAYHEAAHAVMALYCHKGVHSAQVSLTELGSGQTVFHPSYPRDRIGEITPGNLRKAWEETLLRHSRRIRILLAGPLAEAKLLNQPLRSIGARDDLSQSEWLAFRLEVFYEELSRYTDIPWPRQEDYLNFLRRSTRAVIGRASVWEKIRAVALELERRNYLSGGDVALVIQALLGLGNQLGLNSLFESSLRNEDCNSECALYVSRKQGTSTVLGRAT